VARVLRGGAFNNNADNCRSAYRNHRHPANTNNNVGVRLASALSPARREAVPGSPAD